jgi:actin related protein 2/3 complex subunit 1A/1B
MPKEHQLVTNPVLPVTCHAWNADATQLALSPTSNEVIIYNYAAGKFTESCRLTEHTQTVTSIDWSKQNRIVTCAQDRNAYVWNYDESDKKWKPSLVLLRINRAATCAKWSPDGNKFAVGSGARIVSVCYFEEANDWWVSKHIKKPIRSTVLCLSWYPDNSLLACGGSDFKARIFCAAIKEADKKKPEPTCWGDSKKFGDVVGEFAASPAGGGWVHDVAFSANGTLLAYVAHDSCLYVVDGKNGAQVTRLKTPHLPMLSIQWVRPTAFITAGHDYVPYLYTYADGTITELGETDGKEDKSAKDPAKFSALKKFQNLDSKGTEEAADLETAVSTTHQNAINNICIVSGTVGNIKTFSTSGKDGKVVLWDMAEITTMPGMKV